MNSEDNMIFNCGTFSTDGAQLVFENPNSEKVIEGEAFEGKAETFTSATIAPEIDAALRTGFESRLTDYAISVKESNLEKDEVAEK